MLLSFLFDIPIFLPLLGVFLFWLESRKEKGFEAGWILVCIAAVAAALLCLFFRQFLLLGLLAAAFAVTRVLGRDKRHFMRAFGFFTLSIFWLISGGLYFDLWGAGGNHFMWYSWLDKMGIVKTFPISTPTYEDFWGFWNLFGFFLFLTYPFVLYGAGRFCYGVLSLLRGIFFGNVRGQTGLWGLITNR